MTVTRRELLESCRDRLVTEIDEADAKELPALSRELRAVLSELEGIPDGRAQTPADEIAARRAARRKAAGE